MTETSNMPLPTLLLIDDLADSLQQLTHLFQPQYRVLAATSGEIGLQVAKHSPQPDLIILDVLMPGLDGY